MLKTVNQSLLGNRGGFTSDLSAVTAGRPPNINAISTEIDNRRIILRGQTDSVFTVVDYAAALEAVPFLDVRISRLDEAPPEANSAENAASSSNATGAIIFEIVIKK
jgi:hypothetical protein